MQPAGGLALTTVVDDRGALVVAEGQIDITTADQLATGLERAAAGGTGDLAVDLAGVSFMDSTGVNALIAAYRRLEPAGRRLTVRNPRPAARRTLELLGLADLFGLAPADDA